MSALIDELFNKSQADAIRKLWEDKSSRFLLQQEIGKKILDSEYFVGELPLTQLMFITTLSPFATSDKECHLVAEIIYWGMHRTDILPLISEHKGKDLAYRCLISLGFFTSAIEKKWKRRGSPSPSFYREVGINAFNQIEMKDISKHFIGWESFLKEYFVT